MKFYFDELQIPFVEPFPTLAVDEVRRPLALASQGTHPWDARHLLGYRVAMLPRLPTLHPGTIPSDRTDSTHSVLGRGLRLWFITCADGASLWRPCHGRPAPLQQ